MTEAGHRKTKAAYNSWRLQIARRVRFLLFWLTLAVCMQDGSRTCISPCRQGQAHDGVSVPCANRAHARSTVPLGATLVLYLELANRSTYMNFRTRSQDRDLPGSTIRASDYTGEYISIIKLRNGYAEIFALRRSGAEDILAALTLPGT